MPAHADNDNFPSAEGPQYTASQAALFLPAALLATGFAIFFLWLELNGLGASTAAHIALMAFIVGLPALLIHAFLRFATIRVQPMTHGLRVQRGFPRNRVISVPWQGIRGLSARSGMAGTIFGSGTLICELHDGRRLVVHNLDRAQAARAELETVLKRHVSTPVGAAKPGGRNTPAATG